MNENNQTTNIDHKLEKLALLMDDQFEIMGFRFGLNFIIDLIPWVGDILTTFIALYIFGMAKKYKVSTYTIIRMSLNIAIYFIIGLIPWFGDIFGAWWKPNKRNLNLVRKHLAKSEVGVTKIES